jgi:DNA polymerase III alpha subunit
MAFVEFEDLTGSVSVTIFSRVLEQCTELLVPDRILLLRGKVDTGRRSRDGGEGETAAVIADAIWAFDTADPDPFARTQVVHVTVPTTPPAGALADVSAIIDRFPGSDPVIVHIEEADRLTDVEVVGRGVAHSAGLEAAIEALLGPGSYRCEVVRRKAPERRTGPFREPRVPAGGVELAGVGFEV